jgi:DNA polymerase-3 subunit delta
VDAAQFLVQLQKKGPSPGYAFLGNELFARDGCRKALLEAALPPEERERGLSQYDLAETRLESIVAEARTLALFAPARLIIAYNAENVLTRGKEGEEEDESPPPGSDVLEAYFRNPTPGVVLLFEATRFDWDDREERKKLERLAQFFRAVPVLVELRRLSERAALEGARGLAQQARLGIADALLAELVEALGYDMARIANEISKLETYSEGREISREELAKLVPEARTSGMFDLTDALASKDRRRALEILDTLTRMDVYLPLQINFLAGVFRNALAVKESGARSESEVNRLFSRLGLPVWPARARQALDAARRFTREQLESAVVRLFEADRDLRRERPEDRLILEKLVWELTR